MSGTLERRKIILKSEKPANHFLLLKAFLSFFKQLTPNSAFKSSVLQFMETFGFKSTSTLIQHTLGVYVSTQVIEKMSYNSVLQQQCSSSTKHSFQSIPLIF